MAAPEFLIIANPTSGAQTAPAFAVRVRELLQSHGHNTELKVTTARGDAEKFARAAVQQGVANVVGSGGDGTLQEIATALDGSPANFGIIPGGRCNDFAHALGLSKKDSAERIVEVLRGGRKRKIDLGKMGAKRFLTVATLGFDSDVSRFVETRKLWVKGTLAYMYGVMRVLASFQSPRVKLSGDFGTIETRILLAATGNASCYGGAMHIAPGANLDDGVFQICIVNAVPKLTVLRILPRVLKGDHTRHPAVRLVASKAIDIDTPDGPQWICADGETLGQTPCRFEVLPGALTVLAP